MCSIWLTKYYIKGIGGLNISDEVVFVFSGTITLYISHRLIGLYKIKKKNWPKRFLKIKSAESANIILLIVFGLISIWSFLNFPNKIKLSTAIPIIVSIAYALPLFNGKRLRDINYIKIILIGITWSWLTVILPIQFHNIPLEPQYWLLFIEKFLFILAITIPFDIRDNSIDQKMKLKTISTSLGLKLPRYLALILLFIALILLIALCEAFQVLTLNSVLAHFFTYVICGVLILNTKYHFKDQYFTGLMDGTMIILMIIVLIFQYNIIHFVKHYIA